MATGIFIPGKLFFDKYPDHLTFYKGMGCRNCGYTGYKDRILISELFEINREIALSLSRGINETQLKRIALSGGMKTMIDDGLLKLNHTTLSEIIRVVPVEMIKEFSSRGKRSPDGSPLQGPAMPPSYREQIQLLIEDPDREKDVIDHLFKRYQAMRQSVGQPLTDTDGDQFRKFITRSHRQVTRKFKCRQVQFEFCAQDRKIYITAAPVKTTQ